MANSGDNKEALVCTNYPKLLPIVFSSGPTPFPNLSVRVSIPVYLGERLEREAPCFLITPRFDGHEEEAVKVGATCVLAAAKEFWRVVKKTDYWLVPVKIVSRARILGARKLQVGDEASFECDWELAPDIAISEQLWESPEFQEDLIAFRELMNRVVDTGIAMIKLRLDNLERLFPEAEKREAEKTSLTKLFGDFEGFGRRVEGLDRIGMGSFIDEAAAKTGFLFTRVFPLGDITTGLFWEKSHEVLRSVKVYERLSPLQDFLTFAFEMGEEAVSGEGEEPLPEHVLEQIARESARADMDTADGRIAAAYIDWLQSLPWTRKTLDETDLSKIEKVLKEDHYGLDEVREEILEFIAVRRAKPDAKAPILCFLGPPGVGKTSLGKSIARATGRKFIRRALGGVRDEAELRGHRRTYIGALPGMIIQMIRKAGTRNPVFMLDEVDKIGRDFHGDPTAVLMEILDPEQNNAFVDHYLEESFDLSEVLFITTANIIDTIPEPLRDRLEIVELQAYTEEEKKQIAVRHIIPKSLEEFGIETQNLRIRDVPVFEIEFEDTALAEVIGERTHDAGMRDTERVIKRIIRKILKRAQMGKLAELTDGTVVRVTKELARVLLGEPKIHEWHPDLGSLPPGVGVVLMVDNNGQGSIGFVEASARDDKNFDRKCTGHLQEVIRESIDVAISRLFHEGGVLADSSMSYRKFLHVHFDSGAVEKDGPSAGLMVYAAIFSAFKKLPIKPYFAATGEIDLKRFVAEPVGGIVTKLLAAKRAGIREVAIPLANRKDVKKMPEGVRIIAPSDLGGKSWREISSEDKPEGSFTIYCVEKPEDVLEIAFPKGYPPRKEEKKEEKKEGNQ